MHSSSRGGAKVVWLAVHTTEGIMRAVDLRAWTAWPGSSHASSDETGVLLTPAEGFVSYDLMAWTLRNANPYSENIEQCGWAAWTRAEWLARPLLLDATARWLADRSRARGIPLRRLTDDEIRRRVPGVLGHGDYSRATGDGTHSDPGPNYPWDVVLAAANAYATGGTSTLGDELMAAREDILNWLQNITGADLRLIVAQNNTTQQQVAGLQAALDVLADAVASGRSDVTADELRSVIREEMKNVVDVQVSVRDGAKPAA